ncbi:type IV toxin-antitoxin system AbiEi family antitoxin [Pseudarthrobacter sp. SSS035]|uniref:type IV toxin-antitoxin system AbiEi family antitoxin n=1 Tax=Pseudarthrobacter sp. SSS035 TaxID=2931399 RepID=UPI00200EB32E|nr:type IV toxin-antitoxin system AbiEi family antitoxin [Pseudarthrobacter sp. SSS035]
MAKSVVFSEFQQLCRQRGWVLAAISEPQRQGPALSTYSARLVLGAADVELNIAEVDAPKLAIADGLSILQNFKSDFLLTRALTTKTSDRLRELGVNHGDLSGRLSIHAPNVVIELEKRPGSDPAITKTTNQRQHGSAGNGVILAPMDILSPKSSQLVFVLLAWPELLHAPMRKIAEAAGVSVGLVPRTLQHLVREGALDSQRQWTARGRRQIARAWLASFPSRLRPSLYLDFLEGPPSAALQIHNAVASGGMAVPHLISPSISTFYVPEILPDLIRDNRLRRGPQPNVRILRRFWDDKVAWAEDSPRLAPPLLIYADLLASDDPREQEVAIVYLQKEPELQWL